VAILNMESMMALLPIILFVTIEIYEKVKIKMYSNDEKTDMILIYGEGNKNACAVAAFTQTINKCTKTIRFFTISFNQANDVYVKIYETARLTMFFKLRNKYPISKLILEMYCGLHFQFRRAHYHS
jgi:hypothetical protein